MHRVVSRVVVSSLALCLTLAGCASRSMVEPPDESNLVRVEPIPSGVRSDPATIENASIEGDALLLQVRHGGGCAQHDFALYAPGAFMESQPVQMRLMLTHDAHGDPCRALVGRELRFDLTSLKDAYRRSYGAGSGTIVLHVQAPGGPQAPQRTLTYTF